MRKLDLSQITTDAPVGAEVVERSAEDSKSPGHGSARMRFRILGPLEVDQQGQAIPLGSPQQRTLLALLVVHGNGTVPSDLLVSGLWGEDPPPSARSTIYSYVSHLRKLLGPDRIVSQPSGYRLGLEPSELDAARFEALLQEAAKARTINPRLAATVLEQALGLWRGPALADVSENGTLVAEASRLDELRLVASEEHIDTLLAIGESARAIVEAEALIDPHPLRERIWHQLMLALYREGRQADALTAYQRVREVLADELGIDPSPDVVRLHERILRQDPALELRGEPLRGYRLLEKIDEGPTGVVFRAIQPHVGREVALKIVHEQVASDPSYVRRFEPEAQAAAALEHPHILPIYDYWREPGRAYVVSRYCKGGSLATLEARGERLGRDRATAIVEQIGSALAFAHAQHVAHGHLGASNVLFDGEGNAYLADFRVGTGAPAETADDVQALASLAGELFQGIATEIVEALGARTAAGFDAASAPDLLAALRGDMQPTVERAPEAAVRNPYKGLRAFTEADAADFFGRSELIARLLTRLGTEGGSRFVVVAGPSGTGKSSVVRAGVVPSIRRGALGDPDLVFVTEMFPGAHPLEELEAALFGISTGPASRVHDLLYAGSRGLLDAVDLVLAPPAELVLIVDQFEEVFTLAGDERERELFLESLRVATADPESRLRVIVTLRADFYDRPLVYPRFGELLASATEVVSPLSPDETEQAIRRPAEGAGITPEPGLVAEIVTDVARQPGALPLLQYALTELFERRDGNRLTLAAYWQIGGVAGALSARADRILASMNPSAQRTTRQVLLRLVTLGEGREDTRRRVVRSELDALEVDTHVVDHVVETFGRHRLLTFDRDPSTREPTVEIAHEALLTAWGQLRTWIDDGRDDLRQDRRLIRAAGEWRGSDRDPSFLLRGTRLQQAESWASSTDLALGLPQREYLKASLDERDREAGMETARLDRERRTERRSQTRLRALVAVLSIAALIAAGLTFVATRQSERAEAEAREASARELAAAAVANLADDQQLSVLLAIEAVQRTRSVDGSVTREAEEALHRAVTSSRVVTSLPGSNHWNPFGDDFPGAIDWGPGGLVVMDGVFASEGRRPVGVIDLRNPETGQIVRSLYGHDGRLTGAEFSADGSLLATTAEDGRLTIWDLSTDAVVRTVPGHDWAWSPSISADGSRIAAVFGSLGERGVTARVVDMNSGQVMRFPISMKWVNEISISPNGKRLVAVSGWAGQGFSLIDVETGSVQRIKDSIGGSINGLMSVAWSPDGRHFAAGGSGSDVLVLDAKGGTGFLLQGHSSAAYWVEWGPDGTHLLTGSADGTARIWEIGDRGTEVLTLTARAGLITGVAFSPDGTQVMTRSASRVMDVWDVAPSGGAEIANVDDAHQIVSFTSQRFVTSGPDDSLRSDREVRQALTTVDLDSGKRSHRPIGWFEPPTELFSSYDFSPDGKSLMVHDYFSDPVVWDVETGAVLFTSDFGLGFDWSPDGRFAALNNGRAIAIVDRSGREVGRVSAAGFSFREGVHLGPHGLVAFAAGDDPGHVEIMDWARDEVVAELPVPGFEVVRFDPDGSTIATGGADTTIWDVRTGRRLLTLASTQLQPNALAFSPDGRRLAEGDPDGTVRIFNTRSGEELLVLRGHDTVDEVAFSPDGTMLATVGDGMARIWALELDDLIEIARQKSARQLTDEECWQYLHVDGCPTS